MMVPFGRELGGAGIGMGLLALGSAAYENWSSIQNQLFNLWPLKENVIDQKIIAKRDDCLSAFNQFQIGINSLKNLNISDPKTTKESIKGFMNEYETLIHSNAMIDQLILHVNEKTKTIWDSSELGTKTEMLKRLSPMVLDIHNIPKSSSEIVGWVTEATVCTENRLHAEEELQKSRALRDIALKALDECRTSQMPLYERKGQCSDLEVIKEQTKDLTKDSRKMLIQEGELNALKERQAGLIKKEKEYDELVVNMNILQGKFTQVTNEKTELQKNLETLKDRIKNLTEEKEVLENEKLQTEKWFITRWAGY